MKIRRSEFSLFSLLVDVKACHALKLLGVVCIFPGDCQCSHPPTCPTSQSIQIQNIGFLNHWQYGFQRFEHLDFYNFQTWSIFHNFWLHCICMSVPNHNKFNQKLDSIVWMCFRIACMSFFLLLLFWGHHLCNPNKKIWRKKTVLIETIKWYLSFTTH